MAKLFTAAGDRLLGLFLGTRDAGACVPEHGDYCCKKSGRVDCYGHCA